MACHWQRVAAALFIAAVDANFIVILDAGSTGTRAHAYSYTPRVQYEKHFPVKVHAELSLPEALGDFKVTPGISSFSTHPQDLEAYLAPLMDKVKALLLRHDPLVDFHEHVPIYLGATAGMRMLDDQLRDTIMKAIRDYFMSSRCPFRFKRKEQARVLAGEEEGAFGWLATNVAMGSLSASSLETHGALDLGGASAQISFIPQETSILSNMFPMHFGNFSDGPIHLYTHSFLQYGYVVAFQRSSKKVSEVAFDSQSFKHPCLPGDVVWNTTEGQYGVSTAGGYIERQKGPVVMWGSGNFVQCRALAREQITRSVCPAQPCSLMSVYQPRLSSSKFLAFGEYAKILELLQVPQKPDLPVLQTLALKLEHWCSMTAKEKAAAAGFALNTDGGWLELSCWLGCWVLEFLTSGLGFPIDTRNVHWGPDIDWTRGQAMYEINFFPFVIDKQGTEYKYDSLSVGFDLKAAEPLEMLAAPETVKLWSVSVAAMVFSAVAVFAAGYALGRAERRSGAREPLLVQ
eukprot:TRINITY_DN8058_c0_g1_i2.p1 TRINITY_DN8058_c0_g1~~TRINITY_DN8058_c0_g1_i2.p1  ORF type:complete len:535 (+),score=105.39 TRINITY_DN8058_c0_g1_i2:59-1606(+)